MFWVFIFSNFEELEFFKKISGGNFYFCVFILEKVDLFGPSSLTVSSENEITPFKNQPAVHSL